MVVKTRARAIFYPIAFYLVLGVASGYLVWDASRGEPRAGSQGPLRRRGRSIAGRARTVARRARPVGAARRVRCGPRRSIAICSTRKRARCSIGSARTTSSSSPPTPRGAETPRVDDDQSPRRLCRLWRAHAGNFVRRRRHRFRAGRPDRRRAARQERPQGLPRRTQSQRRRRRLRVQEGRLDDRAGAAPDRRSARSRRAQARNSERTRPARRNRVGSGFAVLFGARRTGRRNLRSAGRVRRGAPCARSAVSRRPRGLRAPHRRDRDDACRRRASQARRRRALDRRVAARGI